MQNQLGLSGEKIVEKVYPHLLHHVGLIRGEYLLRELNQNILLPNCQQFEINVVTEVFQTNPNLSVIFPFVNDAEQLKQAITVLRQYGFTGKVGTMIELPSAYFDLDRILETGISKIVVGMNDLTSFIFATVRNSQWHDMESPIMLDMLRQMQDKAKKNKIDFAVAGYLNTSFIQKMNQMGIECIIHYSSIPEIFNLEIDHPDHLKHIKEESKKLQRRTNDTSRNVECLQAN